MGLHNGLDYSGRTHGIYTILGRKTEWLSKATIYRVHVACCGEEVEKTQSAISTIVAKCPQKLCGACRRAKSRPASESEAQAYDLAKELEYDIAMRARAKEEARKRIAARRLVSEIRIAEAHYKQTGKWPKGKPDFTAGL